MKAYKRITDKLRREKSNIFFLHYSCQSLGDDNEGFSPRITSIAVLHMISSQMHSFSVHLVAEEMGISREEIFNNYDAIEKQCLKNISSS